MELELGVRYRAGRDGARIDFRDGHSIQLQPFASIRLEQQPLKITGQLLQVRRRRIVLETKV
jgi:hypothetical protein